jgi:hypothetical protein
MNPIPRNVLAVVVGITVCLMLNGFLLGVMMDVMPPPPGFDPNELDTYALLQNEHLLSPFVAHSVPSFIGGLLAALIAASRKHTWALVVGGLHLLGGIVAAFLIPAPVWFTAVDLFVAYLPMAWLGGSLACRSSR